MWELDKDGASVNRQNAEMTNVIDGIGIPTGSENDRANGVALNVARSWGGGDERNCILQFAQGSPICEYWHGTSFLTGKPSTVPPLVGYAGARGVQMRVYPDLAPRLSKRARETVRIPATSGSLESAVPCRYSGNIRAIKTDDVESEQFNVRATSEDSQILRFVAKPCERCRAG